PLLLAIEPCGRLRFAAADQTLIWSRLSNSGSYPNLPLQNQKNPPKGGFLILVGPGGFEPPTSTMSRPIGRTKTRVDALKLMNELACGKR
ncbi:MAG: hypothetical protein EBZ20_10375, partial [Rhodobacteraceae bacterium]|nr:hypothetical protein [Paracoccaceae bacterium]